MMRERNMWERKRPRSRTMLSKGRSLSGQKGWGLPFKVKL